MEGVAEEVGLGVFVTEGKHLKNAWGAFAGVKLDGTMLEHVPEGPKSNGFLKADTKYVYSSMPDTGVVKDLLHKGAEFLFDGCVFAPYIQSYCAIFLLSLPFFPHLTHAQCH